MEYSYFDFFKLLGSLGFFLYGMKLMSESLQKVAGERMRHILSAMTSNKFKGVLTGIFITAIIQSSSATTVMVVSFVNAGLLSLTQSIGVIMGANIGTTVTAWLISLLGFKVNISMLSLPLIGVAVPFVFSKNSKKVNIGQLIIGFAILFMGLAFLKDSVPDIKGNPEILEFIAKYSSFGFGSILIFLATGTFLTVIIQSSSAVMALTLVMCFNGWITFEMAAAMVLGENIGTTITANLAAIVVNHTAKRAARAHLIFNLIGVLLVLIFFKPFLNFIDWFLIKIGQGSPLNSVNTSNDIHVLLTIALSVFHTTFNFLNTFLQIWFIPYIAKIVTWIVPSKDDDDEIFKLKHITSGLVSIDEISMIQAKNELIVFIDRTLKMYNMTKDLVSDPMSKEAEKLYSKIQKYEEIADTIEEEITNYLTKSVIADLSENISENTNAIIKLASRIESLNDSCITISSLVYNKRNKISEFSPEMKQRLNDSLEMVDKLIYDLPNQITKKNPSINIDAKRVERDQINVFTEKLNLLHLKDIKKGVYKYKAGIIYCDIFSEIANVGDHAYHTHKYINDLTI